MNKTTRVAPCAAPDGMILPLIMPVPLSVGVASAPYAIRWHAIDSGGSPSTGGVYSVSGWTNPITVPATLPTKFYRLFQP